MKTRLQSLLLLTLLAAPAQGLTLAEAIQIGVRTHPDLAISEQNIRQSQLDLAEAQTSRLQYSADLSTARQLGQSNTLSTQGSANEISNTTAANANLGLVIPLFTGFKLTQGIRAAEHSQVQASLNRDAQRAEVTYEITQAFLDLSRQELQSGIRQEALNQVNRTLELTKQNLRLGRVTTNELDRAELNVLTEQGALLQQQTRASEARAKLATLLGIDPQGLTAEATAVDLQLPKAPPALETTRVRAAKERKSAADAMVSSAQGDRWPQLSLASNYQYGNNPFNSTTGARGFSTDTFSGNWDVRLTASFNLLDTGKVDRKIAKAESDRLIAQAQLEKAQRDAKSALDNAWIETQGAHSRLGLAEKTRQVAERTLKWIEKRYQQGYALQVEVNEVRSQWVTAKSQYVDALIDYQLAQAQLKRALGTW